jgi:tetratricopeptide (TPR) repeat protein
MIQIGQYVDVMISSDERRRAIVATIDDDGSADLIFLKEYANSSSDDIVDDVERGSFRVEELQPIIPTDLSAACTIEDLRLVASNFFRDKDWCGATSVYREILHRLEHSDTDQLFLYRLNNQVRLGQLICKAATYLDFGVIDPSSKAPFQPGRGNHIDGDINQQSVYRVYRPFEFQSKILLNLGRCLQNRREHAQAREIFSYALFISVLSEDDSNQHRSKCFYWRARCRHESGQYDGALRDARCALRLSGADIQGEIQALVKTCEQSLREEHVGMRRITHGIMHMLETHLRSGALDINI